VTQRTSKVKTPAEAFRVVKPGTVLSMTCTHYNSVPMAAMRELIRQGARDLTIIPTPSAGLAIDLLIGAGAVKKVFCSYVGLEALGLAPNFRRAVEQGTIEVSDIDETSVVLGYRAAATGLGFAVLPAFYGLTDLPRVNPEVFKEVKNPFTGEVCYAMPPLKPDVAVIHVQQCDEYGNARQLGGHHTEMLIAKAARHVIITTEEIIPHEEIAAHPTQTTVPGFLVKSVVKLPYGCHPGACPTRYFYDRPHVEDYAQLAREGRTGEYIDKYVHGVEDHAGYLELIGESRLNEVRTQ
jgi:glutaconate CoA-transferase, subunit A